MNQLYQAAEQTYENQLLDELAVAAPWALIERFTTLVRESGSDDERMASQYISDQLTKFGVPHEVYDPPLFLSVPVSASLEYDGKQIHAKTPSFSTVTGADGLTGEAVFVKVGPPEGADRIFHFTLQSEVDVRGKIVVCDGYGFPEAVHQFQEAGAIGQIYINRGVDIHWGICTSIWGAPDLDSAPRQPDTPVIAINRPDGEALMKRIGQGDTEVTIHTELKEGWFNCPIVVAEIKGTEEPERFVLAHGHYDSWDVGIGDNAVGDATLLELARVFNEHRDGLKRTLRVAWWPAHSTGRYGGSTWYVDNFGLDLARNCVAQVDIDSPGCRWATEYYDISWMTETEDFCVQAIKDATGQSAHGERPHQAGDYSFNNIGISSFFMLLSTMPKKLLTEKGYYPTGGCGGNIAWHTENDQLEIADRDNLMRDLRVYVTSLQRVVNNPIHPFDFRKLAQEFRDTLTTYSNGAGDAVDFSDAFNALDALDASLAELYARIDELGDRPVSDPAARKINDALLEMGRVLVQINYTRHGMFRNEPAVPIPQLPDIEPAMAIKDADSHEKNILITHVRRGINRVAWAFELGAEAARRAVQ